MLKNVKYEKALYKKGVKFVAGVDEVGRGALAGPLVVCAVILPTINDVKLVENTFYSEIDDSKVLSAKKRHKLSEKILNEATSYSIVEISNVDLDKIGISKATQKAFSLSIKKLKTSPDHVLTDLFKIIDFPAEKQTNIKRGDKLSITIGAASIVAKVYRDSLMTKMHKKDPGYGFDQHKGYGTKKHLEMINKHGPSKLHRLSFEPIKSFLKM